MAKTFTTYLPNSELEKTFIHSIWSMRDTETSVMIGSVMPSGSADIIFNFSDHVTYRLAEVQQASLLPEVFISGARFKPIHNTSTGKQYLLGIQLSTLGLRLLFDVSAKEFTDKLYAGQLICPSLSGLADQLYHQCSFSTQVETILKWVRKKMMNLKTYSNLQKIQEIVRLKSYFDLTVKQLSQEICLGERQLRRISTDWLGMNTEAYLLYCKYLNALELMQERDLKLTEIALRAGYYDQSHFIREFKSFTELPPKTYRKLILELPEQIC
jgi:AraC-like DNA-binding protein